MLQSRGKQTIPGVIAYRLISLFREYAVSTDER